MFFEKKNRLYLFVALLLLTPIRGVILIVMPIIPLLIYRFLPFSVDKFILKVFIVLTFVSSLLSLLLGWNTLANVSLSIWLFYPVLVLLLARLKWVNWNLSIHDFINFSVKILFIINIIGLFFWLERSGDAFGTGYGRHYEYVHGLAMVNIMYFLYYASKIIRKEAEKKDYLFAIILLSSFVCCDFGLGWVIFFFTIIFWLLIQKRFKYILGIFLMFVVAIGLLQSERFSYERNNINCAMKERNNARKVLMFTDYRNLMDENILIPLLGTGSGAYNSRATVLLSGNNSNAFTEVLGTHKPRFYRKYIYPLWNRSFVSQDSYTDGTRNKPYSSLIAIFAEYGIVFGVLFFSLWIYRIYLLNRTMKNHVLTTYGTILNLFLLVACVLHEWVVSSEFVLFLVLNLLVMNDIRKEKLNIKKVRIR